MSIYKILKKLIFKKEVSEESDDSHFQIRLDNEIKENIELDNKIKENLELNIKLKDLLAELSRPLETSYNVKLLWYRRYYHNNKILFLVNDEEFRVAAFERELWSSIGLLDRLRLVKRTNGNFYKYRWFSPIDSLGYEYPQSSYMGITTEFLERYNKGLTNRSWYGISVYYKGYNSLETFAFCSEEPSAELDALYNADFWVLKRFILYFKESLRNHIPQMNDKLLIDSPIDVKDVLDNDNFIKEKHEIFVNQTKLKKILIWVNKVSYTLTYREAQCLYLLAQGKTGKEIAKELNNAPKTIESRIERIKRKLGVKTKAELLNVYFESNLSEYLLIDKEFEYLNEMSSS